MKDELSKPATLGDLALVTTMLLAIISDVAHRDPEKVRAGIREQVDRDLQGPENVRIRALLEYVAETLPPL